MKIVNNCRNKRLNIRNNRSLGM